MTSQAQRDAAARVRADRDIVARARRQGRARSDARAGPMGEWTFKDMTSHLAAWRNTRIPMIEAIGRGEPVPSTPWPVAMNGDFDAINDWFHRPRSRPDARGSAQRLRRVIRAPGGGPRGAARRPGGGPECPSVGRGHVRRGARFHRAPARRAPAGRPRLARRSLAIGGVRKGTYSGRGRISADAAGKEGTGMINRP